MQLYTWNLVFPVTHFWTVCYPIAFLPSSLLTLALSNLPSVNIVQLLAY